MDNAELDAYLRALSPCEILFRDRPEMANLEPGNMRRLVRIFAEDMESTFSHFNLASPAAVAAAFASADRGLLDLGEEILIPPDRGFIFSFHPRFMAVPAHQHDYIELVYVYSGRIAQSIGGQEVELREGEACVLDTMARHSLGLAGSGDVVVNCLVRRSHVASSLAPSLAGGSPLSGFFLSASLRGSGSGGYMVFRAGGDGALREILCRALREQLDPGPYSGLILDSCLAILLAELARVGGSGPGEPEGSAARGGPPVPEILRAIREDCAAASLSSVADRFGLKPSYLGELLRSSLGRGFREIVHEARLRRAAGLLAGTDATVEAVAGEVGYSNLGFFYRLFRRRYGETPAAYRARASAALGGS